MRKAAALDETDRRLINALQGDFPLVPEPYRQVGEVLGLSEDEVLRRLDSLLEHRVLTRFGPMFQIERAGGAFVLAAMRVPEDEFDRVAGQVNAFPEVAHNYRREHSLNMWFVLATATPQGIAETIVAIEAATGYPVFAFPKEREYFVEMKLRA
ncbi:MAG: AsnC family transcriptional regulator [Rhodocyclales bacterium]|jgi:DNA-binding Lrp family transcriptional regulator|nr:AsnC family transcriptional regulator [Rhodocyclales bacterium]